MESAGRDRISEEMVHAKTYYSPQEILGTTFSESLEPLFQNNPMVLLVLRQPPFPSATSETTSMEWLDALRQGESPQPHTGCEHRIQ
jgi:hypothetical protein